MSRASGARKFFLFFISLMIWTTPVWAGGPVVLMGIDAEDGGPGGHGPISVYVDVVNNILSQVSNGGSGILVIGGGKGVCFSPDDVTAFWDAVASGTGQSVTYVNGDSNIQAQSFAGFAMLAVVSDEFNTFCGGLTQAENDALATRVTDVAAFVNGGGGLLGFSSDFFAGAGPYAYLSGIGGFSSTIGLSYFDITPTPAGSAIGITDDLDICCWHDTYDTFPGFLQTLATDASSGNPAAIGGADVIVAPFCGDGNIDTSVGEQCDDGNTVSGDGCSASCLLEVCGNNVIEPGEECDDGNTSSGDGCSASCTIEGCGNGILEPGEECDDGNTVDGDGCSSTCEIENEPPDCSGAASSIALLWPPNHQFVPVNVVDVTDPDGDAVSITVDAIAQDEPVKALGGGNTCPDGVGVGTDTAEVRAERAGTKKVPGDGRVYHIAFTADDGQGGTCTGEVLVCVPHDQGQGVGCVDQGPLFNSTVCP